MIKFAIGEYIRNIGYNIISIFLLAVTFIACTIFLTNFSEQQRLNNYLSEYLDDNSIIIARLGEDFDVTQFRDYEKSTYTRELYCVSEQLNLLRSCLVYNEYDMEKLPPRLIEGDYIDKEDSKDELMQVLVSENDSGVDVGDIIEIGFYSVADAIDSKVVYIPAKVTGIIASGQKLLYGNGVSISKSMQTKDIYGTYSFQQLGYTMVITTADEICKLPEEVIEENYRCIVKFDENITADDREKNFVELIEYEKRSGIVGSDVFPNISKIIQNQKEETKDILIKYIPLTIAVSVLLLICIICMVSIKNANSMRYYATLYMCGMPYQMAVKVSGIEMLFNNIIAVAFAIIFISIQNKKHLVGEINCEIGIMQLCVMISIIIVMILSSTLSVRKILKEHSPMNVLRDTAY